GEPGHHGELFEQRVLEHAPGLVRVERLVAVCRHFQRVPGHEHYVRPLALPEPRQHVGDADDRVPADRLRQRVIGAVGERVAVDCEQQAQSDASSSWIFAISRSVASWAASETSRPRRSSISTGEPYATRRRPRRASLSVPLTATGTSGTPASRAIRAAPERGRASNLFTRPFVRRVPSGNIATTLPSRARRTAVSIAAVSCWPRRTGKA